MRALFRVSFGKKKEYYIDDYHAVEYQLGDALIAVLSTDLKPFLSKLDHNSYDSFALLSSAIVIEQQDKIKAIHPFFEMEMIPLSNHASPMKEMERRLEVIMKIQQDLTPLVDAVFLPEHSDLTTM